MSFDINPRPPTQWRIRKGSRVEQCENSEHARRLLRSYRGKGESGWIAEARAMLTDTQPAECWSRAHV